LIVINRIKIYRVAIAGQKCLLIIAAVVNDFLIHVNDMLKFSSSVAAPNHKDFKMSTSAVSDHR
jgi:hypothetical protein